MRLAEADNGKLPGVYLEQPPGRRGLVLDAAQQALLDVVGTAEAEALGFETERVVAKAGVQLFSERRGL
jgi:hypothetical protein